MKRSIFMVALCCAAFATGVATDIAAQGNPSSTLVFDEQQWDFGTVREQDGTVTHRFGFTNKGRNPVVIERVEVECGCTKPEYSTAPVKPGERGTIAITYDPTNRPGAFLRAIEVWSGNGTNYNRLTLKGAVIPRPRTVADDYPVELTAGVRLTGLWLDFDFIGQGRAKSKTVGYVNTSNKSVTLRITTARALDQLSITAPQQLAPGTRGEITVTYDLSGGPAWGRMSDDIYLWLNGIKVENPIMTAAVGVDAFGGIAADAAPRAKLPSLFHHFGEAAAGKTLVKEFTLSNEGKSPLTVRDVQCGGKASTSLKAETQIAAGKEITFKVMLSTNDTANGRTAGTVTIILNDPAKPLRELRVVSNVK
ncbi:MAG: DUF1573 domain-containing protein [Rikenellaceae bacterium]|nr:DUF1573 domain-containing protein [Rikenellaceae bacterium]